MSSGLGFKPKEQRQFAEALETLAHRDLVLFRYEDPAGVFRKNLLALCMLPMWTYLGYFAYTLKTKVSSGAGEEVMSAKSKKWVYEQIVSASTGVAVAFVAFGTREQAKQHDF